MTLGVHPLFCSKTCFYMFLRSKQTLTSCNLEASVTFRLEQLVKLNPLLSWSAESLSTGESFRFTSISWCDLIPAAAAKWAIGEMSCLSFVWFLWLIVPFFVCFFLSVSNHHVFVPSTASSAQLLLSLNLVASPRLSQKRRKTRSPLNWPK